MTRRPIPVTGPGPKTCTVAQAAAVLGISTQTAYRLIRRGTFPVVVIPVGAHYRVSRPALDRLLSGKPAG